MGIGIKLKEYRNNAGLTQKDLADQLHITYQAVSRWENDDAEPSIDMLKDLCKILNCTADDLFEIKKEESSEKTSEEKVQVVEKVVVQETKPVLAVCEVCNKPIYEPEGINRITLERRVHYGRSSRTESYTKIHCKECNEKRLIEEKKEKERLENLRKSEIRKRRVHSFVWPSILCAIILAIAISLFANGNANGGIAGIVIAILAFTFLGTMILNNTFVTEMWMTITSWGFVRLPGVIFEFSLDGFIFLIVMKVVLWIIGFMIALLAAAFATALSMIFGIFVYPFALKKNLKYED